jgi:hypothetical protein
MTQAKRVHSTPHTNTSATNPLNQARRHFLTVAAGGALAAVAITTAAQAAGSPADPIFAAMEAFRRADAVFFAMEGDITDEVADPYYEARSVVMRTRPTTLAGLVALTGWVREHAEWLSANSSYMDEEELCVLTATIADATAALAKESAA